MFIVGKVLTMLMLPTALMVECTLLGWLLGRSMIGRMLLFLGVAALTACLLLPVESWLINPLEDRFPPVTAAPPRVDGIVVLGGAIDDLTSRDRDTPILNAAANRMTTFVTLARIYPQARLVFTGGSGAIEQGVSTEAAYARILCQQLGLAPERVVFEDQSRTTRENAVDTAALVRPQPGETWVLVTSASHMPRAVGVFRQVGWTVVPWPVGYLSRDALVGYPASLGHRLEVLDWGAHEWIGLVVYYLRGWTGTVFPAP